MKKGRIRGCRTRSHRFSNRNRFSRFIVRFSDHRTRGLYPHRAERSAAGRPRRAGQKYPGSFVEEAYHDAAASLYKVIVKKSDGWSATVILDKEGFIRQASETPAA